MMQSGLDALSASQLIQPAASAYTPTVTYPNNDFANRLKLAAAIITSSLNPKIVYVTLGGFDTHAAQQATQNASAQDALGRARRLLQRPLRLRGGPTTPRS